MGTLLVALGLLLAGGLAAAVVSVRAPRTSPRSTVSNRDLSAVIGPAGCVLGCAVGLIGAVRAIAGPAPSLRRAWSVPYGEIALEIDPLSAFFLLIVFGLCLVAAIYGASYFAGHTAHRRLGPHWFFFDTLVASMAVVVTARNGILFLVAWEVMALASFFLVTFDDDQPAVRDAGRLYLVATHAGTAFLIALFVALAHRTGSMDFAAWRGAGSASSSGALFLLAVIGFGTKAGLVPFHVWLPESHPAAPSHVSAVMSAVMIKMGLYGLIRALGFLGAPASWWSVLLLGAGIASALIGILHAVAQQDIKRLLAYSSVENVGLVTIGLGIGVIGLVNRMPVVTALGFAGALWHVLNHAVFKGLLFMGAGAVARQTGTRQIDRLGGLMRTMPITGLCFLAGAVAICGLPPLNGFIGELVLFLASYRGAISMHGAPALLPLAALAGLALAGALAAACFLRLFGAVFLGHRREEGLGPGTEPPRAMRVSMATLTALCGLLGIAPGLVLPAVAAATGAVAGPEAPRALDAIFAADGLAAGILRVSIVLVALTGGLALLRRRFLAGREIVESAPWSCGYERPTPRMQYTASSFGEPIRDMFAMIVPARRQERPPTGYFPASASFRSETVRPFQEWLYWPAFDAVARGMSRLRWLHHGRVQLYVLYIVVTLIAMLAWFLWLGGPLR